MDYMDINIGYALLLRGVLGVICELTAKRQN